MFVQHCKLVNRLTTEWQIEIRVESQEPCFHKTPSHAMAASMVDLRRLMGKDHLETRIFKQCEAAKSSQNSFAKLNFDIGELKDPYSFLDRTPRGCRCSVGFG